MNNSPAGWWKEGKESAKRWGGVTLVPAGCRSPGRCCGNHSHQPDGISVGEHQKDGSGSVLPGPARPQKQLQHCTTRRGRGRKRDICRKILQSQVMRRRRCGQIRWKCSLISVLFYPVSWFFFYSLLILLPFNCPSSTQKMDLHGYDQSRPKRLAFDSTSKNLGTMPSLHSYFNPLCCF